LSPMPAASRLVFLGLLPSGSIRKDSRVAAHPDIGWQFCQSSFTRALENTSQAIQWFTPPSACKDVS
jgi:hypothetical protein